MTTLVTSTNAVNLMRGTYQLLTATFLNSNDVEAMCLDLVAEVDELASMTTRST